MSILIKGMEMPKGCWWQENGFYMECPLFDADHYCSQLRRWIKSDDGDRPHDCPLIEVYTPHGRLIDADALKVKFTKTDANGINLELDRYALKCIDNAPTIIEAEEGAEE